MRPFSVRLPLLVRILAAAAPASLVVGVASHAHAQSTTNTLPLPNVLLLIDNSGSMERMPDNSLPKDNRDPTNPLIPLIAPAVLNQCSPGVESNPNRWGMLVQGLTGNLQPFYSCAEMSRAPNTVFTNEFKIANRTPYDTDYFLPYHRPLTGVGGNACVYAPYRLPGSATGVGPSSLGSGGSASDLPADAFASVKWSYLSTQYAGPGPGSAINPIPPNDCVFDQATDGQLDASRDYVRFGLMMFDNDTSPATGVTLLNPPPNGPLTPPALNVDTANPFLGQWTYVSTNPPALGVGLPAGCATPPTPFDVGARHWAAPPWEGRMVLFPNPTGSLFDVQRTNDDIQKVILSSRPYGATPIDGMLEDARDYLWRSIYGPNSTTSGYEDRYYKASTPANPCREAFIILLTDGSPNLNLRPQCTGPGGVCPYNWEAWEIADQLFKQQGGGGPVGPRIRTYVIGFSVNGSGQYPPDDGFPGGFGLGSGKNNCKTWYADPAGGNNNPLTMQAACATAGFGTTMPPGSTAEACCKLNQIAFYGSGGGAGDPNVTGPYFAESQADLTLSFGRVLASVTRSASSRTTPDYTPLVTTLAGNERVSAKFVATYVPNALRPWSGEIDRTRTFCAGGLPNVQAQTTGQGDSYATNLAAQAGAKNRFFISVKGDPVGTGVDSAGTIRPYTTATVAYTDGIPDYFGAEVGGKDMALAGSANWAEALDITDTTCKRSRAPQPGFPNITLPVPALTKNDCRDVIWQFTVANPDPMPKGTPVYDFQTRCRAAASGLTNGTCSISGGACTVGGGPCPTPGEVCVPGCAALGAIFRAQPTNIGPPTGLLREDAFRDFAFGRRNRRPVLFAATTDGVLHAFKSVENTATGGSGPGSDWELWSFVPPAVLPRLAANYPGGQQILLDGSPVVKDVVWDRSVINSLQQQWHTTLVAGFGQGGPGYYALNVSDADCGGGVVGANCNGPGDWVQATSLAQASPGMDSSTNGAVKGPHFLWQLTDVPQNGVADKGKKTRKDPAGNQRVALFGQQSGTPAIATVRADPEGAGANPREIGVAILPGGIDGPPVKGGSCARGIFSGYPAAVFDRSDPAGPGGTPPRNSVRQWAGTTPADCTTMPVPGRSVTIVRLDTGEIIRHFGRAGQDVPAWVVAGGKVTDTPFDSPIVNAPVVYPSAVGVVTQRVFVGDADGTLWSIDVSHPDPALWKVVLFQDLIRTAPPTDSAPIGVTPVVSLDPSGALIVHAATGDQENIVATPVTNYVYAMREPAATAGLSARTKVLWYQPLPAGERVTGPMTVFDRTLYFASHLPEQVTAGVCGSSARSRLWGVDFILPAAGGPTAGGYPRWCARADVDPITGACVTGAFQQSEDIPESANAIIPGVTLRQEHTCSTGAAVSDDLASGIGGFGQARYNIEVTIGTAAAAGSLPTPRTTTLSLRRPPPVTQANIDAWALVID